MPALRHENKTSNDHVVFEKDELGEMLKKVGGLLSRKDLLVLAEKRAREAKNEKEKHPLHKTQGGNANAALPEIIAMAVRVNKMLPHPSHPVWKNSKDTMRLFHSFLGEKFSIPDDNAELLKVGKASEYHPCLIKTATGKADLWQAVCALPLVRVDELLVVAPTGSGKSFIMSEAALLFATPEYFRRHNMEPPISIPAAGPMPRKIVYAIRGDVAKNEQAAQIVKNSAFELLATNFTRKDKIAFAENNLSKNPIVDAFYSPTRGFKKIINFLSFAQCGNALSVDSDVFVDTLLIVDEVHELQKAREASGPTWAKSVQVFEDFLTTRRDRPPERRGKLLALTATPFLTEIGFVKLLNVFCADDAKPLDIDELVGDAGGKYVRSVKNPNLRSEMEACGLSNAKFIPPISLSRFAGFRIVAYSIDLDKAVYAPWSDDNATFLTIVVPPVRTKAEEQWVERVTKRDAKKYLVGSNAFAVDDKKTWSDASILYPGRQRNIAISFLQVFEQFVSNDIQGGKRFKTMIFFPTEVGALAFFVFAKQSSILKEFRITFLSKKDSRKVQSKKKSYFDAGNESSILVTSTKDFGTGVTFADNNLLSMGLSRGPHRIFYVQTQTFTQALQVEGRARRRCLHSGWSFSATEARRRIGPVKIERFVVVPSSAPKGGAADSGGSGGNGGGVDRRTCYSIMREATLLEKPFIESILPALFFSSFTKEAFWSRRPLALRNVIKNDAAPAVEFGVEKEEDEQGKGFFAALKEAIFG